jgi:hypothetical protein
MKVIATRRTVPATPDEARILCTAATKSRCLSLAESDHLICAATVDG